MDEKTTEGFKHLRECTVCGRSWPLLDGVLAEHSLPMSGRCAGSGQPPQSAERPDAEMRELAGRMAEDESMEGNFAAAAALKAFAGGPVIGTALEPIPMAGEGLVMLGGQLEALTTTASWRMAFAADLRRLLPQVTGAKLHADHVVALAGAFVDAGWVPGARRRAAELPKATAEQVPEPLRSQLAALADPDRYEEQPIEDADGTVIGHIWELHPRYCLEHEREWIAAVDNNEQNRPRFGSRDGAERWVRANALRDGRPLTVPYDAEKVLGVHSVHKTEAIGWVWPDPEHVDDDGRWCAVHGADPANVVQCTSVGRRRPRDRAIGWVLEQDRDVRNGSTKGADRG